MFIYVYICTISLIINSCVQMTITLYESCYKEKWIICRLFVG